VLFAVAELFILLFVLASLTVLLLGPFLVLFIFLLVTYTFL